MDNIKNFFVNNKDHFQYDKEAWGYFAAHYDLEKFFIDNNYNLGEDRANNIFMQAWKHAQKGQWEKIAKKYRIGW